MTCRMTIHQKREKKDHGKKRLIEKVKMAAKKLKREKKKHVLSGINK